MSRIPFVAAVVGALLIGGATTGGTHASWVETATLGKSSLTAGRMTYTASTPDAASLNNVANASTTTSLVLDDTSLGKNLRQNITATISDKPSGVSATIGTNCPGAGSVSIITTPTSADQTLCIQVAISDVSTARTGNVTVSLSSAQSPTPGWTTTAIQRQFQVTVTSPAPSPPTISCGSYFSAGSGGRTITWLPNSAQTFTVYKSTNGNADIQYQEEPSAPHSTPFSVSMPSGADYYFRVKASTSQVGPSGWSNTLHLYRQGSGNGSGTYKCDGVSP